MTSLFMGLETGKKAIMTNQTALAVTGHNISNAGTTGYTRQIPYLSTTTPLSNVCSAGQIGTGVEVDSIQRIRSAYLDAQYRQESTITGYWDSVQAALSQVELILNEPSDDSLSSVLDDFWSAWEDLTNDAGSSSTRGVVAQSGAALADTFNQIYNQLNDLYRDINHTIQVDVDEINSTGAQIVELNKQIMAITATGQNANDLCDKRDLLLDQLSKKINIEITYKENGMVDVTIGSRNFIQGKTCNTLSTKEDINGISTVIWADTGMAVQITGGEMAGNLDARDQVVAGLISDLNAMAKTVVYAVNSLHEDGYSLNNTGTEPDGTDFFVMPVGVSGDSIVDWAQYIKVNQDIIDDPQNIAAASAPVYDSNGEKINVGDSSNALALAALKDSLNTNQTASIETAAFSLPTTDFSFTVNYGNESYTINVTAPASWADMQTQIQNQLDTAIGTGKVTVELSGTTDPVSLTFSSEDDKLKSLANFINEGENYSATLVKEIGVETDPISLPAADFDFTINYGGKSYTISVTAQTSWEDLQAELQSKIDAKLGAGKITVELSGDSPWDPSGRVSLIFTSPNESFTSLTGFITDKGNYYVMQVQDTTVSDFWSALASEVGVQSKTATTVLDNQEKLISQLDEKRQSVSGVSLDEEAINMIQFQQAYNSASRFITVIDEMLDKLINNTGVVGL